MKVVLRDKHGENGTTRLYYLQFAHSVETLIGRFCRQRKNKNHNNNNKKKKNLQASRSRSNTCPNNEPCRVVREGLQPVCRSGPKGSNNGTNLKQNGTKSHDGRRFPLLCSHRQAPRGGEPTHQDRQHQGFQFLTLFFFSCVSIFFQVLSGSASFASPL